jgi:hypothetical protein
MALKTDFSDISITSMRASIATVVCTLKAWEAIDNTISATPVIEEKVQENNVKIYVEGETPEKLAARIKDKLKDSAQGKIDYYNTEQGKINTATSAFTTMVSDIDGELKG